MSVTPNSPTVIPIDLLAEVLQLKLDGMSLQLIAEHCYVRGQRDAIRDEMGAITESPVHVFEKIPKEPCDDCLVLPDGRVYCDMNCGDGALSAAHLPTYLTPLERND